MRWLLALLLRKLKQPPPNFSCLQGEEQTAGHSRLRMYRQSAAATGMTDSRLPLRSNGISASAASPLSSSRLMVRLSFLTNFTSTSIQRG